MVIKKIYKESHSIKLMKNSKNNLIGKLCLYKGDKEIPANSYVLPYNINEKKEYDIIFFSLANHVKEKGCIYLTTLKNINPKDLEKCDEETYDKIIHRRLNLFVGLFVK